jgi:hypothetical protein
MANRYWVGGTGTWSTTSTTNWSASSGGASGASVPTAADSVFFDQATTYTVTLTGALACLDFTVSAGTVTFTSTGTPSISGSMSLVAGTVWNATGLVTFTGSGSKTLTTNNVQFSCSITFSTVGATWQLQDNLSLKSLLAATLTSGTLDLNSKTLTAGYFATTNTNVRAINFGTGKISLINSVSSGIDVVFTCSTYTNLSYTGTPLIELICTGTSRKDINTGAIPQATAFDFSFPSGTARYNFVGGANTARNISITGSGQTVDIGEITVYGDFTCNTSGGSVTFPANVVSLTFAPTSATKTLTTGGVTIDLPIIVNGSGGTLKLLDNLTMGSAKTLTHTNGTIDLNGKTLTVGTSYTTAAGTKNLTFNGGTLVCPTASTTAFNNAVPTGFTTTAGTSAGTISMTAATAKTFVGGGSTYNCTLNNGGAGALTITGSNTFTTLANSVQPTTFTFTAGTTTTVSNWNINGTAGNLVTIGSATAATHTLSKSGGTVSASYLSISYSTASGGATWYAGASSTNGGNNTGWLFSDPPTSSLNSFFFLFN